MSDLAKKLAKKLARIKQLIGMSASSSEEEARSMAILACRLIRESAGEIDVVIVSQQAPAQAASPFNAPGTYSNPYNPVADAFRQAAENARTYRPRNSSVFDFEQILRDLAQQDKSARSRRVQNPAIRPGVWQKHNLASMHVCSMCGIKLPGGAEAWESRYEVHCIGCGSEPL